jgi:hypothetical protein
MPCLCANHGLLKEGHTSETLSLTSSSSSSNEFNSAWSPFAPVAGFASEEAVPTYAPDLVIEPTHMTISLAFDFANKTVAGSVETTFISNATSIQSGSSSKLLKTVKLNAVSLSIEKVESTNDSKTPLSYSYDGKHLAIEWSEPFAAGEKRKVLITYKAEQPIAGTLVFLFRARIWTWNLVLILHLILLKVFTSTCQILPIRTVFRMSSLTMKLNEHAIGFLALTFPQSEPRLISILLFPRVFLLFSYFSYFVFI